MMTSWSEFEKASPELAAFGKERLNGKVAYLGTVRANGRPRVHPVTPIISAERLFLFMEPTSPKGKDLQREGHFALHATVEDSNGGNGEFYIRGIATLVNDAALREEAAKAGYKPQDHYILFTLSVEYAFMNIYTKGAPTVKRWQSGSDEG
jgi:hypothetical protein